MLLGYKPLNKNKRWPFPTLHIFFEGSSRSSCSRVSKDDPKLILVTQDEAADHLDVCCEHCFYGRQNLKETIYGKGG